MRALHAHEAGAIECRFPKLLGPIGGYNLDIVRPARMDDRTHMRYKPGDAPIPLATALDWSAWGGFDRAVEMCNNNGACRKSTSGVMCPSYRATLDEQHVTRGRANTRRAAPDP